MGQTFQPSQRDYDPAREAMRQNARYFLKKRSDYLSLAIIVNLLLLYLFQTAVAWLVVRLVQVSALPPGSLDVINELYTLLVYGTAFLLPYLLYAKAVHFPLAAIPREKPYLPVLTASVGVTLGVSVVGILLSILVSTFFAAFGFYPPDLPLELPANPIAMVLFILNITLLPAVMEEFTYRGIVLGSLRPWGDRFAIVVSALLFALLHRNMAQFPNALLAGLALGYFMVKTDSIWTSMILHFVNNLLILLLAIWTQRLDLLSQLLIQGVQFLVYLLAGGLSLRYFWVRRLDLRLNASGCPLGEGACARRFFWNFPAVTLLLLYGWIILLNFT